MSNIIEAPRFSCALGGALNTVTAIEGLVPIIHAGPGCGVQLFTDRALPEVLEGPGGLGE